ncbi:MAG TPA: hypothetical protein PKD00_03215 [Burkholderiales bacterium]|nr:hypothetical protein [Burkholderiales bacterium]
MSINIAELKVGDKVCYRPSHYSKNQWENGIVKEIPNHTNTAVRVVYNCAGDWDNFMNYTSQLTNIKDLTLKITKHNFKQAVEDCLKLNNIRYSSDEYLDDNIGNQIIYNLYISSLESHIQCKYNNEEKYDDVYFTFYIRTNEHYDAIYETNGNTEYPFFELESEIEALIKSTKNISSALSKIEKKIEQIEDICKEYSLDIGDFITINYKF